MSIREEERTVQRRLSYLTGGLIVASPFLGLVTPSGRLTYTALACAGGVLLVKGIRALSTRNRIKKESGTNESAVSQNYGAITPESPETAIARRIPSNMARLLERESERRRYNEGLEIGARVAQSYIGGLNPEEYSRISEIEIIPQQENKILGIPLGRKSLEVKVKR